MTAERPSLHLESPFHRKPDRRFGIALGLSAAIHALLAMFGLSNGHGSRFEPSRYLVVSILPTTAPQGLAERLVQGEEGISAAGSRIFRSDLSRPKIQREPAGPVPSEKPSVTETATHPSEPPEPGQAPEAKETRPDTTSIRPAGSTVPRAEARQVQGAHPADTSGTTAPRAGTRGGDAGRDPPTGIAGARPGPYRPGSGVTPPRLIYKVQPKYPEAARAAAIQGAVELEIIVTAAGSVTNVTVLKVPSKEMGFEAAATDAVLRWRFLPGSFRGTPVDVIAQIVVTFTIEH